MSRTRWYVYPFFFNDTATTEIYTLSLHDALPICFAESTPINDVQGIEVYRGASEAPGEFTGRSEEHTSELQSLAYLVCRLLLEKKNNVDNLASLATDPTHSDNMHDAFYALRATYA